MSTISASTTSTTAYKVTADTTGTLVLQTGSTPTTAMTLGTDQSVTFAQAANLPNTFGFKNRFINGAMLVAQYGTGANISSSNNFYSLDRWQVRNPASTGGTVTYAQVFDSTTGVTKLRLTYASATSGSYFQQKIEAQNVTDLWGSQVTVSVYSNDTAVSISVYSYDASGTEATVVGNASLTSLGGNRYSYTFTLTTPAGGIRGGNALGLLISINVRGNATPANSTNYDYWNCQLEKGSTATSFDFRSYGTELALCQRYFYAEVGGEFDYTTFLNGSGAYSYMYISGKFNVPMRTTPSLTWVGTGGYLVGNGGSAVSPGGDVVSALPTSGSPSSLVTTTAGIARATITTLPTGAVRGQNYKNIISSLFVSAEL